RRGRGVRAVRHHRFLQERCRHAVVEEIDTPVESYSSMTSPARPERSFGIIGGLSPIADADLLSKLIEATERHPDAGTFEIVFEQRPFARTEGPSAATTARMLYIFNRIDSFKAQG